MYRVDVKKIINSYKFKQAALCYQKNGYYTPHPLGTTAYIKYWDEETIRCLEGYTSEDGDYISGYNYFYLNYSPIIIREEEEVERNGRKFKKLNSIRSFPNFWDYDKVFFDAVEEAEREGKHLAFLKPRGIGASFKGSSMLARNYFLIPESTSLAITEETESLTKDGILTKCWDIVDFINEHTAWSKKSQKINTKLHKRASLIIDNGTTQLEVGYKSEIIGLSVKNNPDKPRGKRFKLCVVDEIGLITSPIHLFSSLRHGAEEDGEAFGLILLQGTGGKEQADYTEMRRLFYEPDIYNFLEVDNIWDDGKQGTGCGFFWPRYYNMRGFMDEDGNSLIKEARNHEQDEREKLITKASDKNQIDVFCAERPFCPEESLLQVSGNIFPKKELLNHLTYIQNNETIKSYKQVGSLVHGPNGLLQWIQEDKPKDITSYRIGKNQPKEGSIVIWEHPEPNSPWGLYSAGCLTPGEKVLTELGLKNVEDITLEDRLINKDGDFVNINTLLRYDKVDEPVFKVHMSNVNRPTVYTQEHPLLVSDSPDGDYDFTKVKDVKEGMWTKYPNVYNREQGMRYDLFDKHKTHRSKLQSTILHDEDFWWFVGHWLGDGFNHKYKENYTIYNSFGLDETEYVDKYKSVVGRLFDRSPNLKLQNGSNTHKFECKQLFLFLEENFGKYAIGKYIPEWVKFIPIHLKKHLILGYLDSDGSVYKDRNYIITSFKSINKPLLRAIQDILFSIGVVSSFNISCKECVYNINGKNGISRESYSIKLNQTESKKLADHFLCDYSSRKLRVAKNIELGKYSIQNKSCMLSDDLKYIYIKIKNIDKSFYTGIVYNFDCKTHSFITQYCTGHNCDPYDHSQAESSDSLGSIFIYKGFQSLGKTSDTIVAEYTGRPTSADDFYENVRLLLLYYNARCLYENQWPGLSVYMRNKHSDYLLADQPSIISKIINDSKVNRGKGIHMTTQIKDWAELKIRDWLIEEYEPGKLNLTKILSEPLLEELIIYNGEINTDRVIALMMIMIFKEELHDLHIKRREETVKTKKLFESLVFDTNRDFYTFN